MSLIILIAGLQTTLTTERNQDRSHPLAIMDRLAAMGQTGQLHFEHQGRHPEEGGPYFELFGMNPGNIPAQQDLPLAYAMAGGSAGKESPFSPDPKRTWCCLSYTHLYQKQNDLIFMSAQRTGQTLEECLHLTEAFLPELQEAGWHLHDPAVGEKGMDSNAPATLLLYREAEPEQPVQVKTTPLSRLAEQSLRHNQPSGPYSQSLMQLVTSGQLVLATHPLNRTRQRCGRLVLNTPWIWGVGNGQGLANWTGLENQRAGQAKNHCWTADPLVAGLAHASGYSVSSLDEMADFSPLLTSITQTLLSGSVILHLHLPAVFASHGLAEPRQTYLQRLNDQLLEPLSHKVATMEIPMLLTTPYSLGEDGQGDHQPVPWVMASSGQLSRKQRFWHRQRLGQGNSMSVHQFRELWLA